MEEQELLKVKIDRNIKLNPKHDTSLVEICRILPTRWLVKSGKISQVMHFRSISASLARISCCQKEWKDRWCRDLFVMKRNITCVVFKLFIRTLDWHWFAKGGVGSFKLVWNLRNDLENSASLYSLNQLIHLQPGATWKLHNKSKDPWIQNKSLHQQLRTPPFPFAQNERPCRVEGTTCLDKCSL